MDTQLVIGLVVLLVLFAVGILLVIRFYLFRNVTDVTSRLDKLSEDHSRKEEAARQTLAEAEQKASAMLARAEKDVSDMKIKGEKEIQIEREQVIKAARLQSDHIVQQANKTRDFLLAELDEKVREAAIVQACELVQQVIPDNLRRGVHVLQVRHMLGGGLQGLAAANFPAGPGDVHITSAYDLAEDERDNLHNELRTRVGMGAQISDETDPSLIAGLVITVGGLVIDGSLKHSIQEAAKNAGHTTT